MAPGRQLWAALRVVLRTAYSVARLCERAKVANPWFEWDGTVASGAKVKKPGTSLDTLAWGSW
jgi:hypothetical protein